MNSATVRDRPSLLLPVLLAVTLGLLAALLALWPGSACAQRDPEAEVLRKPGGAIQRSLPVPPQMREGLMPQASQPQPSPYFREREDGWFWYRDPALASPPTPTVEPPAKPSASNPADPLQRIAAQRERLEKLQALAILEPSAVNVASYLREQQALMEQSQKFADAWQQVVWTNPTLDNTLRAPTGSAAYVQADVQAEDLEQRLAASSQRYGLLFFFRGSCPYCHRFAPVLQAFAQRHGFTVLPVTLDGGTLPEYPSPQPNDAAATALQVESVPAVYVVDPQTRRVAAASFGLIGYSELAQRVDAALQQIVQTPEPQGIALTGAPP